MRDYLNFWSLGEILHSTILLAYSFLSHDVAIVFVLKWMPADFEIK